MSYFGWFIAATLLAILCIGCSATTGPHGPNAAPQPDSHDQHEIQQGTQQQTNNNQKIELARQAAEDQQVEQERLEWANIERERHAESVRQAEYDRLERAYLEQEQRSAAKLHDDTEQQLEGSSLSTSTVKTRIAASGPVAVTYTAAPGKVSFKHQQHAAKHPCSTCHPTKPPVRISLGKEKAHLMCKGCHLAQDAPTDCSGCHKKN